MIWVYNVAVKYVKKTCKYLFSHLPRLLALSIAPAAIVAFFMQPAGFGLIIPVSAVSGVEKFSDIFFLVFKRELITRYPYMIAVGLVLMLLCISFTMGMEERHFKTGKLTFRQSLSTLNNCVPPIAKVFLLLAVIYVIYKILVVCVLTLFVLVLENWGAAPLWVSVVVGALSAIGFIALLIAVRPLMFASATMLVYGYSFKDAFSSAIGLDVAGDKGALNFALIAPFIIYLLVSTIMVGLSLPSLVQAIVNSVLIALIMQYVVTYVTVAMFELSGIERRDCKKYY